MSLTSCLKKAGSALHADDRAAILSAARLYRAGGMKPAEAATKAFDDQMAVLQAEITKAEPPVDGDGLSEEPVEKLQDKAPNEKQITNS